MGHRYNWLQFPNGAIAPILRADALDNRLFLAVLTCVATAPYCKHLSQLYDRASNPIKSTIGLSRANIEMFHQWNFDINGVLFNWKKSFRHP